MSNIVLIGFMGTGKSTIGEELAKRLGYGFVDTDLEIENITGYTVSGLFAEFGVAWFRSKENMLIEQLAKKDKLVIATGGGVVLDPANITLLKKNGVLVRLHASGDVIYDRVAGKKTRPLLARGNLRDNINSLMAEREGKYREAADLELDTSTLEVGQAVEKLACILEKGRWLFENRQSGKRKSSTK